LEVDQPFSDAQIRKTSGKELNPDSRELLRNMGREVDGVIRAILKTSGTKLRMEYGAGPYVATISPEQIIQPEKPDAPEDVEL